MIDRHPALIARCTGAADVVDAVRFARDRNLLLSVRGGGHNVTGSAVCDGGLMIDLSPMDGVHVDPSQRTARVQGGAAWHMVDRETQLFGLATPSGYVSTTGVAGLTLGGGFGHLRRKYGLSCDNLISVDIVTADGQVLTASEQEHPDLFWGVRGGGGNFGIVTSFEFRLYPVGPQVFLCAPIYPMEEAPSILRGWQDFMETAPEDLSSNAVFWTVPEVPGFPEEAQGEPMLVLAALFPGAPDEGERLTMPLRRLGTPLLDLSGIVPYTAAQAAFDPFFPYGTQQYYFKATYLDRLGDDVLVTIAESARRRPSPMSLIPIWHFGGAMSRVAPTATAFWSRRVPYMVSFDAVWSDPADAERNIDWARSSWAAVRKYSDGGLYLNFPGFGEEGEALVRAAYGDNYERLVAVKNRYDPTNLFRINQNIKPG
jgi:FAD/FMN-containing dehydrogenase